MGSRKTLSFFIKLVIGVISFWVIYSRLSSIPELKQEGLALLNSTNTYFILSLALVFMPINWGIESYKWQSITRLIEPVSYSTALQSVFSGICLGNVAPGRAMEFLAKIFFFNPKNRPGITILHFINGIFQMLITVSVGMLSICYKLLNQQNSNTAIYGVITLGVLLIIGFILAISNVSYIQRKMGFIKWFKKIDVDAYVKLPTSLIIKLIILSIIRYAVFTFQFYIIYQAFSSNNSTLQLLTSIAAYFVITSLTPMISVIEPAIRAAIALFVFNDVGDNGVVIILASTFLWIINVVVPSVIGYLIILNKKIDFKSANDY